jgi:hypothetical protein
MEIEARDLFIQRTEFLMSSKGFRLVQNENERFDYLKKTTTGYNQIQILPSFYGGNCELGLALFLRFDDINALTNHYRNVVSSAYDCNPTFGASLSHFHVSQESLIIKSHPDIVKVVDMLYDLMNNEIFNFFDSFSTLNDVDAEFNRENRSSNLFLHDAFDRPVVGITAAALTQNPRFEYWEKYYREKLTTVQRRVKYDSLIGDLRRKKIS